MYLSKCRAKRDFLTIWWDFLNFEYIGKLHGYIAFCVRAYPPARPLFVTLNQESISGTLIVAVVRPEHGIDQQSVVGRLRTSLFLLTVTPERAEPGPALEHRLVSDFGW